jgi:predicted dehydrogenase
MIERVLMVGLGSIGLRHLRLARELLSDADIRILRRAPVDTIPELANGCFASIDQAIAFAPDVAVLANPAPFHAPVGEALARAGCHLLVEKPLADNRAAALTLMQACRDAERILQVGYNLRFMPSLLHFKAVLDEGRAGAILSVRSEIGQYLPSWRPGKDYRHGVSAKRSLGGGVLLELSHELDYLRWLFGEVDWVGAVLSKQSNLDTDVEDTAHLTLGFAPRNGMRAVVASLDMDFIRHDTTRVCSAIGEHGTLRWDSVTSRVDFYDSGKQSWQTLFSEAFERDFSYRAQWRAFLDSVGHASSASPDGSDGLAVLDIVEAARQSDAKKGQRVQITRCET